MVEGILKDFVSGPLDCYRRQATFDWKKLKTFIETAEHIQKKVAKKLIYDFLDANALFNADFCTPTLDDCRLRSFRQTKALLNVYPATFTQTLNEIVFLDECFAHRCPNAMQKILLNGMFRLAIELLGSHRHRQLIENKDIVGCFALTEVAHGSNMKGIQTTVHYDPSSEEFIINTPDFKSAKCWMGNLGQTGTYMCLHARLITPDNIDRGLHLFLVPIRDPTTLLTYPGVTIGDLGEKIGLNGIDNGFAMFNNYRIPRENLLNQLADVTRDGEYVSSEVGNFNTALTVLSSGRVVVTGFAVAFLSKALTIAIRYSAVRKQFSGENQKEELPILEYPTQQWRLFPHLAGCYVLNVLLLYITDVFTSLSMNISTDKNLKLLSELQIELHSVISASKAISGWMARDAIQECRECCGGHGYLQASGLGHLRNDNDANCTYEGDNTVLIQQSSNWLLKLWDRRLKNKPINVPMGSADFIEDSDNIIMTTFTARTIDEVCQPQVILNAFRWLNCWLLKETYEKLQIELRTHDTFTAKNNIQVFYAYTLSKTYIQYFMLKIFYEKLQKSDDSKITNVMTKLFSLFGLSILEKHLGSFYEGGFIKDSEAVKLIKNAIIILCDQIKPESIALIDAIAPPDSSMNSVLGQSNGEVYKNLQAHLFNNQINFGRPSWWQEVVAKSKM